MYINWRKLLFALIYLFLTISLIIIQTLLPLNNYTIFAGLALTITTIFSSILFASSLVTAFHEPLTSPNIPLSLLASSSAILLVIIQVYLFILSIIAYITLIFPK
jgi:hypothetical protein